MKTVYFVRHAKSSWADMSLRDAQRPLSGRGERDAPFMAEMLAEKGVKADAIVSSPAKRAFTTATYFAKAFGFKKKDILVREEIYEAWGDRLMEVVHSLPDHFETVLIFGHNPTYTSIANDFARPGEYIDNVPTCGIFKVEAKVNDWSDFNERTGTLTEFYYPKQFFV